MRGYNIVLEPKQISGFEPEALCISTESTAATPYQGDRKISYVSYHTRAISMGITKAESRTLIDAAHHAKGRLYRMRVGAPAALA